MTAIYNPILNSTLGKMYSIHIIVYCTGRVFHEFMDILPKIQDEPTFALDPVSTSKIEDLATELKKDYTILKSAG